MIGMNGTPAPVKKVELKTKRPHDPPPEPTTVRDNRVVLY
jgi:hypothetical protein